MVPELLDAELGGAADQRDPKLVDAEMADDELLDAGWSVASHGAGIAAVTSGRHRAVGCGGLLAAEVCRPRQSFGA